MSDDVIYLLQALRQAHIASAEALRASIDARIKMREWQTQAEQQHSANPIPDKAPIPVAAPPPAPPNRLLTTQEAAELLGLADATLKRWRINGNGPPFRRIGMRMIRYKREDVIAWSDKRRLQNTAQPVRE
jgi:excisionase family DNA binding protein